MHGADPARDRRPLAARQRDHPAARGALPAVGCLARRADRHHLARRRARHRGVAGARRGRAQRGGRAHDRDRRTGAALSACAHRVLRRLGPADLRRRDGGRACRAPVRELRHRQGAHHAGRQVARHADENARFTKELVQPKPGERWLLVTSAHHMPRSIGAVPRGRISRSRPIRSITARAARSTCCARSPPSATACAAPTPRRANGSGWWSIG